MDPRPAAIALLANIKARMPQLQELRAESDEEWGAEDHIYRFYHGSFKVYWLQGYTSRIVEELKRLKPEGCELNQMFLEIVEGGTGKKFDYSHNEAWLTHTRPIVEAYFHARHMLAMTIKAGLELDEPPSMLPSGWATVLYLYGLR